MSESSFVESSNKYLQYTVGASKITDPLHRVGDNVLQHTKEIHWERQTEAVGMTHKSLPTELNSKTSDLLNVV